jgi:hypothetical protein
MLPKTTVIIIIIIIIISSSSLPLPPTPGPSWVRPAAVGNSGCQAYRHKYD